jgi:hypothetical protein
VGAFSVGALNIHQRESKPTAKQPNLPNVPATNYTALRLRRDVFRNSDVGVMFLNKDVSGTDYNRAFGFDANFRFLGDLRVNTALAKTDTPVSRLPGSGNDWYTKSGISYRNNFWDTRALFQTIGGRFNDEMGFVPRTGVNNTELYLGAHIRSKKFPKWVRETFPHIQFEDFSLQHGGGLESRYMDWHWPITLQNSTFIEVGVNPNTEVIREPFTINSRRGISVLPGRYDFNENFILVNTNSAAPLSFNVRYTNGGFYDGYRRGYTIGSTVRPNEHMNFSGSIALNDIELPQGAFMTTLFTGRVNYFFNTKVFLNALLQYNNDARQWSSNVRLNIIHRPLSDIFVVYNERRDSRSGDMIDRAVIAKMTYLVAF